MVQLEPVFFWQGEEPNYPDVPECCPACNRGPALTNYTAHYARATREIEYLEHAYLCQACGAKTTRTLAVAVSLETLTEEHRPATGSTMRPSYQAPLSYRRRYVYFLRAPPWC